MATDFLSLQTYVVSSFEHAAGQPFATGLRPQDVVYLEQGVGLAFRVQLSAGAGLGEAEAVDAAVARLRNLVILPPIRHRASGTCWYAGGRTRFRAA